MKVDLRWFGPRADLDDWAERYHCADERHEETDPRRAFFVFDGGPWTEQAARDGLAGSIGSLEGIVHVETSPNLDRRCAVEIFRTARQAICNTASYAGASATGQSTARILGFSTQVEASFWGLVFVDTTGGPPPCPPRPTFLLDGRPASSPAIIDWVEHQGCAGAEQREDDVGNIISTWSACESTLVHVQTVTPSAWVSPSIDGLAPSDFVRRIATFAR